MCAYIRKIANRARMPSMSAGNSMSSVRVSEDEVEVFNTSVDVADSQDGRQRRFSVTRPRASVRPTLRLAQVAEGSLSPENTELGPRSSSPTSIQMCNGFCDVGERPAAGATVVRIRTHALVVFGS